ncbi:UDP-glucuronate 4-epimerase [Devosia sp. YR412]|uniref:NAD-dependent epimerase/dehydratase family protein n=1 Tax=Devosia sp. YR412 TaxID=1881030 RepID=UPI0008BEE7EE|nr:NAD-dependent epimerase/dehydratase family protein [Devosia sp. YR412]SEQ40389.1 UDP-glucuronate 4-epimerase [Devosia sp. YR412]
MSRRVLITGAGGFVGSHLATGFAKLGDHVTAFDRQFDAPTAARLEGIAMIEASLDSESLGALGPFDLVIHGAALTSTAEDLGISGTTHVRSNLLPLLDCLEFAQQAGASQFVFISSSGVFDNTDSDDVLLETTVPTSLAPYAVAKRASEIIVQGAASEHFTAFSIRLGPVFGPYEASRDSRKTVSMVRRWLDTARAGEPIVVTSPATVRDWTFAPDLAPALNAVLRDRVAPPAILHFSSPELTSEAGLAQAIAALVPGTRVEVETAGASRRLPMASMRRDMACLYPWTSLASGLSHIIATEAQP